MNAIHSTAPIVPAGAVSAPVARLLHRFLAVAAGLGLLAPWATTHFTGVGWADEVPPNQQSLDQLPVRKLAWSAVDPAARLLVEHRASGEHPRRFELPADQIDHAWWRSLGIGRAQRLWLSWPAGTTQTGVPLPQLGLEASLEQLIGQSVVVTASRSRSVAGRVMGIESRRVLLQRLEAAEQLVQIPINDIESLELSIGGATEPLADWVGLPSGPLRLRLSPAGDGREPLRLSYTLPPPGWQLRHRLEPVEEAGAAPLRLTSYLDVSHVGVSPWEQVDVSVDLGDDWQSVGPIELAVGEIAQWPVGEPTTGSLQLDWQCRLDLSDIHRSHTLGGSPILRLADGERPLAAGVVELVADHQPVSAAVPPGLWRLADTLWPGGEQELQPAEATGLDVAYRSATASWPRWRVVNRGRARIELRASPQPGVIWRYRSQPLAGELVAAGPAGMRVQLTADTAPGVRIDRLPQTIELNGDRPLRMQFELELDPPEPIDVRRAALETLERLEREVLAGDWHDWLGQLLRLRRQQEQAYRQWELAQANWRSERHDRAVGHWQRATASVSDRLAAAPRPAYRDSPAWSKVQAESTAIREIEQQLQRLILACPAGGRSSGEGATQRAAP